MVRQFPNKQPKKILVILLYKTFKEFYLNEVLQHRQKDFHGLVIPLILIPWKQIKQIFDKLLINLDELRLIWL